MAFNLFDVTHGHATHLGPRGTAKRNDKPRQANEREIKAYLKWIADERSIYIPTDAEFQPRGIYSKSAGGHILDMPGYGQVQTVTMETLDDAGDAISSQTLPVEPKKGGVIWSREDVRKACGKIAKPGKMKAQPVAAPADEISAPLETVEPVAAVSGRYEAASAPEQPRVEPSVPVEAQPSTAADVSAIMERLAALETRVEALSGFTEVAPTVDEAQPRRTVGHERAVRRAWAERKAARLQRAIAADHMRMREQVQAGLKVQAEKRRRAVLNARDLQRRLYAEHKVVDRLAEKRREAKRDAQAHCQRANVLHAQLDKLRADMADPHQPERASDLVQLRRERDEARTALSAVTARAERSEVALQMIAPRIEEMVSRVAIAEAALRAKAA